MNGNGWGGNNPAVVQQQQDPVILLIAAPVASGRMTTWVSSFQIDSRFRIHTFATDAADLVAKMSTNPEVVVIDAQIFNGPGPLIEFLTKVQGAAYVVLPMGVEDAVVNNLRGVPSVKGVFVGDLNFSDHPGRIYADALALRNQAPALGSRAWGASAGGNGGGGGGGIRSIAIWNRAGGSGKSTIAAALGLACAQRGYKTLLVGLGTPDSLPVMLGLKPMPNISSWLARPNFEEGLQNSIQKVGTLDVVVGLQDILKESDLAKHPDDPESLNRLAYFASFGGYGVIIFDAPVSGASAGAIGASNTLLMVAQPTLADAVASAEAYRVVTRKMLAQHSIGAGNILVVLNRMRNGLLASNEFSEAADSICRAAGLNGFPPVATVIPDVPEVQISSNARRSPLSAHDAFSKKIYQLADMMFGQGKGTTFGEEANVKKIGPLRIRMGA